MSDEISPVPEFIPTTRLSFISDQVKAARPDIIEEDLSLPADIIGSIFVEDLGAQQFLEFSRHDLVNGQRSDYSIISNTDRLNQKFNPINIMTMPGKISQVFKNFAIRLEDRVPIRGTGKPVGVGEVEREKVYIDNITGNLIIDVTNLNVNERVEIQVLSSGSVINDTIELEES
jgi:hypothetical protein